MTLCVHYLGEFMLNAFHELNTTYIDTVFVENVIILIVLYIYCNNTDICICLLYTSGLTSILQPLDASINKPCKNNIQCVYTERMTFASSSDDLWWQDKEAVDIQDM